MPQQLIRRKKLPKAHIKFYRRILGTLHSKMSSSVVWFSSDKRRHAQANPDKCGHAQEKMHTPAYLCMYACMYTCIQRYTHIYRQVSYTLFCTSLIRVLVFFSQQESLRSLLLCCKAGVAHPFRHGRRRLAAAGSSRYPIPRGPWSKCLFLHNLQWMKLVARAPAASGPQSQDSQYKLNQLGPSPGCCGGMFLACGGTSLEEEESSI